MRKHGPVCTRGQKTRAGAASAVRNRHDRRHRGQLPETHELFDADKRPGEECGLGIEGTSLSPGVVRMTGLATARARFAETGDLLHDLAGVRVGAKQAERAAAALGRDRGGRTRGRGGRTGPGADHVPRHGRHRRAGAQGGTGGPRRQAGRRLGQDPGGEAGRGLGWRGRRAGAEPARAGARLGQLLGGRRKRRHPRHRRRTVAVRPPRRTRGPAARLRPRSPPRS